MTPEKRKYAREYAARQRAKKLSAKLAYATRCPFTLGPAKCDTLLELTTVNGSVVTTCQNCERRKRGICRDCHLPVEGTLGRALRCRAHKIAAARASQYRSRDDNRETVNERARIAAQRPEEREKRLLYKKVRRLTRPDVVKREKRKALITHNAARERYLAHHRKLNARRARKLRKRAMALLDYYRANPVRPVPTCKGCGGYLGLQPKPNGRNGRPPSRCDGCCDKYELARRQKQGRAVLVGAEPPAANYIPPLHVLERQFGPRICLGVGCSAVMQARAKKCDECKARDVAAALAALAALTKSA